SPEVLHRLTHGGQVDHARHAGEVLHDHAGRRELDLGGGLGVLVPLRQRVDVVGRGVQAVLGAQQVLQQHLEAVRKVGGALEVGDAIDLVTGVTHLEGALGPETVGRVAHADSSQIYLTSR